MIVEIISVGTELLLGNIVNTNAQFIAKELAKLGMECYYQTVVGDNPHRIKNALDVAFSRGDMVILTGGLGPTKDDLTKEMLMDYFHKKLFLMKRPGK
jgi:nicotinamide-nucleotide amidase